MKKIERTTKIERYLIQGNWRIFFKQSVYQIHSLISDSDIGDGTILLIKRGNEEDERKRWAANKRFSRLIGATGFSLNQKLSPMRYIPAYTCISDIDLPFIYEANRIVST